MRMIDADRALEIVRYQGIAHPNAYHLTNYATLILQEAPTIDAVPVRHGRWEQVKSWSTKAKYRCSVCGREIMSAAKVNIEKYPYCHCGAKMEVKE